jgi:hypothetical protein
LNHKALQCFNTTINPKAIELTSVQTCYNADVKPLGDKITLNKSLAPLIYNMARNNVYSGSFINGGLEGNCPRTVKLLFSTNLLNLFSLHLPTFYFINKFTFAGRRQTSERNSPTRCIN